MMLRHTTAKMSEKAGELSRLAGGRCGDRTRDLLRVKQTLYR
jgi:hypothetical protein